MQVEDVDGAVQIDQMASAAQWTPQMFLSEIFLKPKSHCYTIKSNGDMVAYLVFRIVLDEIHFMNLAVHPRWWRRGVGRACVLFALQTGKTRGVTKATLEVRVSNRGAQALYQTFGFRRVGTRRNYYENPKEDALLLTYNGEWGAG